MVIAVMGIAMKKLQKNHPGLVVLALPTATACVFESD
jgi:hypothetical protein